MEITDSMVNAADSVLSRRRPGIPDETIRLAIAAALDAQSPPPSARDRVSIAAKAMADSIGHGMGEKCLEHAKAVVAALDQTPPPSTHVAPIRYVPAKGNTRAEMVENFRADPLYREGDAWLVFANEGDLHMQALRHATAPAPSQHMKGSDNG